MFPWKKMKIVPSVSTSFIDLLKPDTRIFVMIEKQNRTRSLPFFQMKSSTRGGAMMTTSGQPTTNSSWTSRHLKTSTFAGLTSSGKTESRVEESATSNHTLRGSEGRPTGNLLSIVFQPTSKRWDETCLEIQAKQTENRDGRGEFQREGFSVNVKRKKRRRSYKDNPALPHGYGLIDWEEKHYKSKRNLPYRFAPTNRYRRRKKKKTNTVRSESQWSRVRLGVSMWNQPLNIRISSLQTDWPQLESKYSARTGQAWQTNFCQTVGHCLVPSVIFKVQSNWLAGLACEKLPANLVWLARVLAAVIFVVLVVVILDAAMIQRCLAESQCEAFLQVEWWKVESRTLPHW